MRCQFLDSERDNLNDDFCLIDLPVKSFDRESQWNVLLYVSDGFNDKINKEIILLIIPNRNEDKEVAEGAHGHPIFCVAKIKKGNKLKIEFQSRNY